MGLANVNEQELGLILIPRVERIQSFGLGSEFRASVAAQNKHDKTPAAEVGGGRARIAGRWLQGESRGLRTDRKAAGPRSALKFGSECALANALLFEAKFF